MSEEVKITAKRKEVNSILNRLHNNLSTCPIGASSSFLSAPAD